MELKTYLVDDQHRCGNCGWWRRNHRIEIRVAGVLADVKAWCDAPIPISVDLPNAALMCASQDATECGCWKPLCE